MIFFLVEICFRAKKNINNLMTNCHINNISEKEKYSWHCSLQRSILKLLLFLYVLNTLNVH